MRGCAPRSGETAIISFTPGPSIHFFHDGEGTMDGTTAVTNPQHQTNETVEQPHTAVVHDANEEQRLDAMAGTMEKECEFDASMDERQWQAKKRQAKEKRDPRARLKDMEKRRPAYRDIALRCPDLPHAPFRWLCLLLEIADPNLDNCFPRRDTLAQAMGVPVRTADGNLNWLVKHGWIARHEFYGEITGYQSSSGYQFLIPPGVREGPWQGPKEFYKRTHQVRKAARKSRRKAAGKSRG